MQLEKNNQNTGGAYIEKDQFSLFIRGVGMASGIQDIENVVVKNRNGAPVLIRDVALVQEGTAIAIRSSYQRWQRRNRRWFSPYAKRSKFK
jgi:cobalt-zinc-cadmium resistance protein CzcA